MQSRYVTFPLSVLIAKDNKELYFTYLGDFFENINALGKIGIPLGLNSRMEQICAHYKRRFVAEEL